MGEVGWVGAGQIFLFPQGISGFHAIKLMVSQGAAIMTCGGCMLLVLPGIEAPLITYIR